jgi:predicted small integral membrane protein
MSDDDHLDVSDPEASDPSWAAAVTFVTTEHFNLQTARSATIAETSGRASLYLGAVSAGLIAFAFAGQTSRTALYVFGLVLFPVLFFLGLATFRRALQASIADTLYILRINRLRRFYVDRAPQLAAYLAPPDPTDNLVRLLRDEGYRPDRWQTFLSIPAAIGLVNSVLAGATVGLAVAALTGDNLWFGTITALVTFVGAVAAHQRYQARARTSKPDPFAVDD